jgi:Ser/Thr protein kinase RdoA (MazF antagonist)
VGDPHYFKELTPDFILSSVEGFGLEPDGHLMALNSYENRVYQVGVEGDVPVVVKFYRPKRWSYEAITEEHGFCFELAAAELPVVAPLLNDQDKSITVVDDFRLAVYQRRGGRAPELSSTDNLKTIGRFLARIHTIGSRVRFKHRPSITTLASLRLDTELISTEFIPKDLRAAYVELVKAISDLIGLDLEEVSKLTDLRAHGDCHAGNLLWRDDLPNFVDFDDARMALSVQDLWMLLSGDHREQQTQLESVLEGYQEYRDFDYRELSMIPTLRTLRIIGYSAWMARRWSDPAFPLAFPWFHSQKYWEKHILELREQLFELREKTTY